MKIARILLVAAILVVSGSAISHQSPAEAQSIVTYSCADLNDPVYDTVYGVSPLPRNAAWSFKAGDTLTLMTEIVGDVPPPTDAAMRFFIEGGLMGQASVPGQITYTFPADTDFVVRIDPPFGWAVYGSAAYEVLEVDWDVTCSSAGAATDPSAPGCDVTMRLTPDAAVGVFGVDTDVFWGPDVDATTDITMPAGKTAWVLGMDDTGAFYQFIWGCTYLWAPVNTLGPNFDNTWNGTPLPATVVG